MAQFSSPVSVKAVLLGDSGVGKSSLFLRLTQGGFSTEEDSTMGAAFGQQTVEVQGRSVQFNIWDTAGQERYRALAKLFYKDASVAVLVYDITSRSTFESLKAWQREVREVCPPSLRTLHTGLAVVGNKADLREHEAVSTEEAGNWARSILALHATTSAKAFTGLETLITNLAEMLLCCNVQRPSAGVRLGKRQGKRLSCSS